MTTTAEEISSEDSILVCFLGGDELRILAHPFKTVEKLRKDVATAKGWGGRRLSFMKEEVHLNETDEIYPPARIQCICKPIIPRTPSHWHAPSRYQLGQQIGKGEYSAVLEAYDRTSGQNVAIKRCHNLFDDLVDAKRVFRELQILHSLDHPCIVKLRDAYLPPQSAELCEAGIEMTEVYFVMELCDSTFKSLTRTDVTLTMQHIKPLAYHLLCGLKYLHSAGVYHRDLKPANCLVNQDCSVKICDFNLSRAVSDPEGLQGNSGPVLRRHLTRHVVTRWYRAPEVILLQKAYTELIDMWSAGCILAELFQMLPEGPQVSDRGPLFPGQQCFPLSPARSSGDNLNRFRNQDQLRIIINLLGSPTQTFIENLDQEDARSYLQSFTACEGEGLPARFSYVDEDALDLLSKMLAFDPTERIRVDEALEHTLFAGTRDQTLETTASVRLSFDSDDSLCTFHESDLAESFVELIHDIQASPQAGPLGGG